MTMGRKVAGAIALSMALASACGLVRAIDAPVAGAAEGAVAIYAASAATHAAPAATEAARAATDAAVAARVAAFGRTGCGLDPAVLRPALYASACAVRHGLVPVPGLLTVIDYTRPSNEPRLWVLDLARSRVLFHDLVAHGRGSGELLATAFSNQSGSLQSSLGLFVTGESYDGMHGRALRLYGLEPGINDNAYDRAVVMHGADYVSAEFAAEQGRLGRSHGCPALPLPIASSVVDAIQGGTVLFAYSTDHAWLETSRFLGACDD